MMIADSLSIAERAILDQLEAKITSGIDATVKIGEALKEIHDKRLYKHYGTFEDYCLNKWSFTAERARQLINFIEVRQDVPVTNERQARELRHLTSEERKEVWQSVTENMSTKSLWEDAELTQEERQTWEESTPKPKPSGRQLFDSLQQKLTKEQFEEMQAKEQQALERRKTCIENGRKSKDTTPTNAAKKRIQDYVKRLKRLHAKFPDVSVLLDDTIESYVQIIESSHVLNS